MNRKATKMCLVCGKNFEGKEGAFTCGTSCRTFMSRLVAKGKKPEYYFVAKSKGQAVPVFSAVPKPKQEKPTLPEIPKEAKVEQTIVDAPKKPLTPEERFEIQKQIRLIGNEQCPNGVHPKTFQLQKEIRISDLEEKLK